MFWSRDSTDPFAAAPHHPWETKLRRAAGLAVAFLTLDDAWEASQSTHAPAGDADHPHRSPLRPRRGARRPGVVAPRAQHCLTPVERRPQQRHGRVGAHR